jgi:hypothetical protein
MFAVIFSPCLPLTPSLNWKAKLNVAVQSFAKQHMANVKLASRDHFQRLITSTVHMKLKLVCMFLSVYFHVAICCALHVHKHFVAIKSRIIRLRLKPVVYEQRTIQFSTRRAHTLCDGA